MPTTKPRYTLTDTGELAHMLDRAQRRWPEVTDRRQLLLRLAEAGSDAIADEVADDENRERLASQLQALAEIRELVDMELLLSDAAWQ